MINADICAILADYTGYNVIMRLNSRSIINGYIVYLTGIRDKPEYDADDDDFAEKYILCKSGWYIHYSRYDTSYYKRDIYFRYMYASYYYSNKYINIGYDYYRKCHISIQIKISANYSIYINIEEYIAKSRDGWQTYHDRNKIMNRDHIYIRIYTVYDLNIPDNISLDSWTDLNGVIHIHDKKYPITDEWRDIFSLIRGQIKI